MRGDAEPVTVEGTPLPLYETQLSLQGFDTQAEVEAFLEETDDDDLAALLTAQPSESDLARDLVDVTVAGVLLLALFIGGRYQRLAVEVPQGWTDIPENDRRARAQRAIAAAERQPVDWDDLAQHRNAIDTHYRAKARGYGEALADGRMGLGKYHRNMVDALREGHTTQRRLGQGPLSYDAEQRLTDTLNEQMGYLDEFVGQIGRGELSAAQIVDRSGRYGANTGLSYNAAIADAMAEMADTEQRFLGGCNPHCQPCIEYASQGRVPIGTLPPPRVRCDCRERCCCRKEFYDLLGQSVGWIG